MKNDVMLFKKENMKKIIYGLGAVSAVVAPIVATVSCGNGSEKTNSSSVSNIDKSIKSTKVFNEPFKIDGKVVPVAEDGIYLSKADYHDGVLWNRGTASTGAPVNDEIVKLGESAGFALDPAVMLGDNDSVYVLYDQDNNDQMTPDTFNQNLFFNDTSIAGAVIDENAKIGNIKATVSGMFATSLIKFVSSTDGYTGKINTYFGSQSNHMTAGAGYVDDVTFSSAILRLRDSLSKTYPDSLQALLNYYGVMINDQGQVVKNPAIRNAASNAFAPVFSSQPIFTYERVASNAYKVTYHFNDATRITAAHFVFNKADQSAGESYGSLSLGDKQEWDSYIRHDDAKYQAIKNSEIPAKANPASAVTASTGAEVPTAEWTHPTFTTEDEKEQYEDWWMTLQINGVDVKDATVAVDRLIIKDMNDKPYRFQITSAPNVMPITIGYSHAPLTTDPATVHVTHK